MIKQTFGLQLTVKPSLSLQAEADEFAASAAAAAAQGKPLPAAAADAPSKAPPQIPMNQSRAAAAADHREGTSDSLASQKAEVLPFGIAKDAEALAAPASTPQAVVRCPSEYESPSRLVRWHSI